MTFVPLKKVLLRILSGKMSKEEEAEILRRRSVISIMRRQWNERGGDISEFSKPETWDRIESEADNPAIIPAKKNSIKRVIFWPAAACILLLLGIGYYTYQKSTVEPEIRMISVETHYQERMPVILPDSTKVWLNAGSRIEYPQIFAGNTREVKLSGEAYFEVERNEWQSFVVSTDNLQVCVLGTHFAVSDYPGEHIAETVLISGKVRVFSTGEAEKQQFDLFPNEKLLFDTEKQTASLQNIDASQYLAWVNGRLTFDDTDLNAVINRLERWYGVKIECPDELSEKYRLTFTVRDETLEQIAQLMQNMIPVKFKKLGENIYKIEYGKK
jgi:ferric-dicitrate binding protein FerR (iron transport regulator)